MRLNWKHPGRPNRVPNQSGLKRGLQAPLCTSRQAIIFFKQPLKQKLHGAVQCCLMLSSVIWRGFADGHCLAVCRCVVPYDAVWCCLVLYGAVWHCRLLSSAVWVSRKNAGASAEASHCRIGVLRWQQTLHQNVQLRRVCVGIGHTNMTFS